MHKPSVLREEGPTDVDRTSPAKVDHEMVLAALLEAVITFDDAGRVTFVNQATEALLGQARGSLFGRSVDDVFNGSEWITELVERLGGSNAPSLRAEGELALSDRTRAILAEASSLRDRQGVASGTLVTMHDLSSRQSLRDQSDAQVRMAALDHLVASLGHEINNPLSGIRGAAQLLERKMGDREDLAEYPRMIVRQVDRMADLISALMLLEAPRPERRPINIHRVLGEVLLLARPEFEDRGIALHSTFDPSLPDVHGDPDQLQQVFLNVLKNAASACTLHADSKPAEPKASEAKDSERKASEAERPGPSVRIVTRMEPGYRIGEGARRIQYLAIEFQDNGPGLDEEVLAHMFSPLFSKTEGGHGMGLAIAQSIVSAHQGGIHPSNRDEGGACFRITLPVADHRNKESQKP